MAPPLPVVRPPQTVLKCPACGWSWEQLPTPTPVGGYQPAEHVCPNRKCSQRHWVIIYRLILGGTTRLEVVELDPSPGKDPECYRAFLSGLRDRLGRHLFDSESIEFYVYLKSLKPEDRRSA
jgi:hypothetical protein